MNQFESFEVDLNSLNGGGGGVDDEPPVRRRGVTFEVEDKPKDDDFQPAGAGFIDDLDFLENCGGNNDDAMEQLQRKSLYVKFDPLCKSPGTPAAAPRHQSALAALSTPKLADNELVDNVFSTPEGKPSSDNLLSLTAVENLDVSAGDGLISNGLKNLCLDDDVIHSPTITNGHSNNTDTPPDINLTTTTTTTDKISVPPPTSLSNGDLVEPLLYTQSDMDECLRKTGTDHVREMEARDADWQKKCDDYEVSLREEAAMRELIEKDNSSKVENLRRETAEMKSVLSQYEMTIVELTENSHIDAKENEKSVAETVRAKEQMQEELNAAETSVFDAFKRIEKLKQTIDTLYQNEQTLKKANQDLNAKIEKSEDKYEKLKVHAAEKIDDANSVIAKVRKQQEIEIASLRAKTQLSESKVKSLEFEIEKKTKDNAELNQICDDLIQKVSQN